MLRRVLLLAALMATAAGQRIFAATISSFSPTAGPPGTVVTLSGSGFTSATNLIFNPNVPVLGDFTIVSDSEMIGVVPIGATSGNLYVATSGDGPGVSTSSFTVAPQVTSFSPPQAMPGTIVYIGGVNFVIGGTTVTFSGTAGPVNGTVTASTEVGVTVPTGAATGPVTVTTSAGSTVSTNIFTTGNLPTFSSFSPAAGGAGTTVVINGGNFVGTPTVYIGGKQASATVTSTSQINATVPSGATNGLIEVVTSYGSVFSSTTFATGSGAIVTGFSPTIGTAGTVVTINGANLSTGTGVNFNGHAGTVTSYGTTAIQVTVPNASGVGPIEVFTPQGNFITSTNFTNTTGPVITSFSPALGAAGSSVVISGFNFTGATGVEFSNISATHTVTASSQITATVPSGFSHGLITVLSNASSWTTTSNFSVSTAAPYVTGISPTNGARGTVVTVNGGNFNNLSSVQFNGVSTTYTPLTSTTVLYATAPGGATTGAITVNSSTGSGSSQGQYYFQPWITSATASAPVNASLVIQGRNLTNTSAVQVNGVNYSFTNSSSQIVATVPANATSGTLILTGPGGIFINTNSFAVAPDVYSFTPSLGPAGTVVTVNGTSFTGATSVQFHGTAATPANVTSSQLQVAVPSGATTGPITVLVPGAQGVSSNNFTVTSNSTVNLSKTVSPSIIGPGTNVTYTLLITNKGPSIVTAVTVTDAMPSGFTIASSSTTVGTIGITNNTLVATLGTMSTNAGATITVKGTSTTAGTITNTANLGFAEGETIYGTNFAYAFAYFITSAQHTLAARLAKPGEVLVTWPVSGANFNLQVSTNLSTGLGWQNVGGVVVANGLNEYSNSIPATGAQYFRLEAPQ